MNLTEIDLSKNAKDATLTPAKISTNPADNFTFPNNVIVSGELKTPSIADLSSILVIDVANRYLKDSSNVITLDWLNRLLKASDGSTSINFNTPGTVSLNTILNMTGHSITNLADPVNANDAANKTYVDTVAQGLLTKAACAAATTTVLTPVTAAGSGVGKTLTENANGLLVVDGVNTWVDVVNNGGSTNPAASNPASRVLVKNQANPVDNGIYCVTDKGSAGTPFILTRAIDFDGSPANEVKPGDFTFIGAGTVNASSGWTVSGSNDPVVVDTDPIPFIQFSGAGQIIAGNGLTKTGNQLDVSPSDASLTVSIGNINVNRDPAGAIGLTGAGIKVNTDGTYIGISANNVTLLNPTQHTVAGADTQVQFNSSGNFGASSNLTWNGSQLIVNSDLRTSVIRDTGNGIRINVSGFTMLATFNSPSIDWGSSAGGGRQLFSTPIAAEKLALDWNVRTLVGTDGATALLNWASTNTVTLPNSTNLTLTGATTCGSVLLTTADQTSPINGGSLTITTGNITSGSAISTTGGGLTLTTGSNSAAGGPCNTNGGSLLLTAGDSANANSNGGGITLSSGVAGGMSSGSINITTGFISGFSGSSNGGGITLTTGGRAGSGTQAAGSILLTSGSYSGGSGQPTTGGSLTLTAGSNSNVAGSSNGGSILLTTGGGAATQNAGNITLTCATASLGGSIVLTGTGANGTPGSPAHGNIYANYINAVGDIISTANDATALNLSNGGGATLTAPNTVNATTQGGNLRLTSGNITGNAGGSAIGGSITLTTGQADITRPANGGSITLTAGATQIANSTGGSILLTSGVPTAGGSPIGGNITLTDGVSGANGGSIVLTGTGANGTPGSPLHGNIYGNNATWINAFVTGTLTTDSITGDGAGPLNIVTPSVNNNATSLNVIAGGVASGVFTAGTTIVAGGAGVGGGLGAKLTLKGWIGFPYGNADAILSSGGLSSNGGNVIFQYAGTEIARMTSSLNMGIGTISPDASASLDITSTTRGLLPPRMTTAQKNLISSPATGLVVYDTTLNLLQVYNGTSWTSVGSVINFVTREVPSGTINGSNKIFTLAHTPVVGSEEVFLNGLLQNAGVGNDYTISGATITFTNAPLTGSILLVTYRY